MKDQYYGDVSDYLKYGLLRVIIAETDLALGVCWMRTPDDNYSDGEIRSYLTREKRFRHFDPALFDKLLQLRDGAERSIRLAETWGLLPGAKYYMPLLGDDISSRNRYFHNALSKLQKCELVFFDPDNGLEVKSVKTGHKDSSKYIYWIELEKTVSRGQSIILYQHFPREAREAFINRIATQLRDRLQVNYIDSYQTSHVVFFLVVQSYHAAKFDTVQEMIATKWASQIQHAVRLA